MCYLVKLLFCFHLHDQFPIIDIKISANSSFFKFLDFKPLDF